MKIADLFDTPVADRIDPVIRVAEIGDERKLAAELGSYVVTPMIEQMLDDVLEHYTATFLQKTTEIGIWVSGYFGSGKSHLVKTIATLLRNPVLDNIPACQRFGPRVPPDAPRRKSILRHLSRMDQCATSVLAFNVNSVADCRTQPLAKILLSQYYLSCGYCGNVVYARVIESELDKQGKLAELHAAVEARAGKPWSQIRENPSYYSRPLYEAACQVAPEAFPTVQHLQQALKEAQAGELYNMLFLVDTLLEGLRRREAETRKPQRLLLAIDESGFWIDNDQGRLSQLQSLVEESARCGQGKLWVAVTTHGNMAAIYREARAREEDMNKIKARFRFTPELTTENIELVLEDRLLKKKLAGKQVIDALYEAHPGVLRGLGELAHANRDLPACTLEKFAAYYPFFPYQVHLVPEIVKSLRAKGGRGEQMSGSTRTLLAITQDILRAGRRTYLEEAPGAMVSFDEVYTNLAGEGEISPDVRTDLARIPERVPGATPLTARVAEVLFLVREVPFVPRTRDNIARLLVEHVEEDLPTVLARVQPELDRLVAAGLVAPIGEEYEFLTGERRSFEEEVSTVERDYRQQDRERGLAQHFVHDAGKSHWRAWFGADVVPYHDQEFSFKLQIDGLAVPGSKGDVTLKFYTPLSVGRVTLDNLEDQSLRPDEKYTLFFLCGRAAAFDRELARYLAMREVIGNWSGDSHKSEDARRLAQERHDNDLPKLYRRVADGLKEGIRTGRLVFRGSTRQVSLKQNQTPGDALRAEMAAFWPTIYPKFDRVPVRIANDQRAVQDVLAGVATTTKDVQELRLYDRSGKIDRHGPLLDAIRLFLAGRQRDGRSVAGKDLLDEFSAPPYGWDPNAVRVGVAALVRAGAVQVVLGKQTYSNPSDPALVGCLRVSRQFDRAELVLEEEDLDPETLREAREFLIRLARSRKIEETPAALSEAAGALAAGVLNKADAVNLWAAGSRMPLPAAFTDGEDAWRKVAGLSNPIHRVREVHSQQAVLESGHKAIEAHADFQSRNATPFAELAGMVGQLQAIEHRLDPAGPVACLVSEYRAVEQSANFADKAVWKRLQSLKAQATLELTPLLDGWRNEARRRLDAAIERLPADLAAQGLDAGLQTVLAAPLVALRDGLDAVALPAQVAALPDRAVQAVNQLGRNMAEQVKRKAQAVPPEPDKEPEPKPARPVRALRASDVATVTRVATEAEWEALRDKLDRRVRQLLKDVDVELS